MIQKGTINQSLKLKSCTDFKFLVFLFFWILGLLVLTLINLATYTDFSTTKLTHDIYDRKIIQHRKEHVNVLFFAYYRSGSTYLSQILNYHPDIFYLFEPLYITSGLPSPEEESKKDEILTRWSFLRLNDFQTRNGTFKPEMALPDRKWGH